MKKIFFMSGLQRSGSTVLSCILNQNTSIHATSTSPLLDVLYTSCCKLDECQYQYTFDFNAIRGNLTKGIINSFHKNIDRQYVIDKHRGWVSTIPLLREEYEDPKILCTIRPIPEILSSFITLIEKNKSLNNDADKFLRSKGMPITINNRCDYFFQNFVKFHLDIINETIKNYRENIHLIEYSNLIMHPQSELRNIYSYLNIDYFDHDFDFIENTCKEEKDLAWGIENLHVIRNKLQKTSTPPEKVLGKELTEYYSQFNIKYS